MIYADYDRVIRRVEEWVARQNPRVAGCDSAQVRARIVQRVVQIAEARFCREAAERARGPEGLSWPSGGRLEAGGVTIFPETGRVSVSWRQRAMDVAYFAAAWGDVLLRLTRGLFLRAPRASTSATILLEAGGEHAENDENFVEFCRQGPVAPLATATRIIVRSGVRPRRATSMQVIYTSRPFVTFINLHLRRSERWRVLASHLTAPLRCLRAVVACRLNVLVSRDLALLPIVRQLDRKGRIEALVATTSAFSAQPLWAKGLTDQAFKFHMLWYSQNFIPKMYRGDTSRPDLPSARHMRVHVHWVWTQGFAAYLRELNPQPEIHVVGPLLWYLPQRGDSVGTAQIKIAVFDVTPLPDGATPFGAARNYYSVERMKRFVADVIEVGVAVGSESGRTVLILLKHKRMPKVGHHDSSYLEWLQEVVRATPQLKLLDHHANLFGLLSECDLSVSVPYTSTAYVGAAVSKPAVYYDPDADLIPVYEHNEFVHFASGRAELEKTVRECLTMSGDGRVVSVSRS